MLVLLILLSVVKAETFGAGCTQVRGVHHSIYSNGEFYPVDHQAISAKKLDFGKFGGNPNLLSFTVVVELRPEYSQDGIRRGFVVEIPEVFGLYIKSKSDVDDDPVLAFGLIESGLVVEEKTIGYSLKNDIGFSSNIYIFLGIESMPSSTKFKVTLGSYQEDKTIKFMTEEIKSGSVHTKLTANLHNFNLFIKECNTDGSCLAEDAPARAEISRIDGYSLQFGFSAKEDISISGEIEGSGFVEGFVSWEDTWFHFLDNLLSNFAC